MLVDHFSMSHAGIDTSEIIAIQKGQSQFGERGMKLPQMNLTEINAEAL